MTEQPINTSELFRLITDKFSRQDVHDICFVLNIDHENFHSTKSALVRELITYCKQHGRLTELVNECEEQRAHLDWAALTSSGPAESTTPSMGVASDHEEHVTSIQAHKYSGEWKIENNFSLWRSYTLAEGDVVYFHGRAFLVIGVDGRCGSGTQIGKLYVRIGGYEAIYQIANRINKATVTQEGFLHLEVEVLVRNRIHETGEPAEARFREELFGSQEFDLTLYPVHGEGNVLRGKHLYRVGNEPFQVATESYEQVDW
jgi:hypothetical protein